MRTAVARCFVVLLAAGGLVSSIPSVSAQDYPARTIRLIVPYTPGGAVDVFARALGAKLTRAWDAQVVIENKPGAGGNIGTDLVAQSPNDGYTLLCSTSTPLTTNLALYKSSIRYDTERDFDPVAMVSDSGVFVIANPAQPFRTMAELVEAAKAKPGALSIGTSGHGTLGHFLVTRLNRIPGVKITHVPYRGGVPAATAAMTGEIAVAIVDSVAALPFMQDGRVRALAYSSSKRSSSAPDVPSMADAGLGNIAMSVWIACMAPKGTPPAILEKLNGEIQRNLRDPEFRATMVRLGLDAVEGMGPDRLRGFIKEEIPRWRQIVQESGLEIQ
jgi:tripartite-type tricarboxylate transporter receptor subunit TctC